MLDYLFIVIKREKIGQKKIFRIIKKSLAFDLCIPGESKGRGTETLEKEFR